METERRISTGIDGLDEAIDYLRPGDTVVWQCEHISDYMYVATRFVTNVARKGDRIVYIRFADHEEIMDTAALRERGANVEKYELDPRVGFETFAVQVHRVFRVRLPVGSAEILVFRPDDLKLFPAYQPVSHPASGGRVSADRL